MRRRGGERGSVLVVTAALLVVSAALLVGVARLGSAAAGRAGAQTAADAAALAAADTLALGRGVTAAREAAASTAADNGAELERCRCSGRRVEVEVSRGLVLLAGVTVEARATAAAEIGPLVDVLGG